MGKFSLTLVVVGAAACGNDAQTVADAPAAPDAAIDAKVFNDAPPPMFDFTCYGKTAPTTAADPVTIAGTTETLSGQALAALPGVTVETYKQGNGTALDTKTSDGSGNFMTGNLVTTAVPLDGYIKASDPVTGSQTVVYRTTYLFPPNKVVANLASVPVPLIPQSVITQYNIVLGQQDANNGLLFLTVSDCTLAPIDGATLSVKQGSTEVGTQINIGQFVAQLAGVYLVSNVPDGNVTISASYNGMTFPSHVITAFKKPSGVGAVGTVSASAVVPGPF